MVKGSVEKKKLAVSSKVEEENSPKGGSTKVIPLPYWGDGLPREMEMLSHVSPHDKRGVSLNPYRYNLRNMSPRPPLGPSPLKPKEECPDAPAGAGTGRDWSGDPAAAGRGSASIGVTPGSLSLRSRSWGTVPLLPHPGWWQQAPGDLGGGTLRQGRCRRAVCPVPLGQHGSWAGGAH